jgi:hypothetical protein
MEGNQRINSSMKETPSGPREITIMIMGSIGRIRSFTISSRILLWSSIILLLYILLSLFIISRHIIISNRFSDQSVAIQEIREKYEAMGKDLLTAQQRAANLEAYIESIGKKSEGSAALGQGQTSAASGDISGDGAGKSGNQSTAAVDIEDLEIRKLNASLAVDFRLVSKASGTGAIEGYLHIIVMDKNGDFPPAWNAPSKVVQNERPSEFRSGEHFFIQRFKQYHREFASGGAAGMPAKIRILAYDPSGNVILEMEYGVDGV